MSKPGSILSTEELAYSDTVGLSAAFTTSRIRLCATTACRVLIGAAPVVTNVTGLLLPANLPEIFDVNIGDKVSVVITTGTTASKLTVSQIIT
jgi:hypothetical protein